VNARAAILNADFGAGLRDRDAVGTQRISQAFDVAVVANELRFRGQARGGERSAAMQRDARTRVILSLNASSLSLRTSAHVLATSSWARVRRENKEEKGNTVLASEP
jgi:hypothetical protein